jgi:hypothetical protein
MTRMTPGSHVNEAAYSGTAEMPRAEHGHRRRPPKLNSWMLEIGKTLIGALIATSGACWTVRGILGDFSTRIAVLEDRSKEIVPRAEHEAHWEAYARSIQDLKQDLREINKQQTEILLRVTGRQNQN